ncbi:hypothetical protein F511_11093 [Dorcoceras hygrometricum]|uniref:Uncharacterized protein n=1 Tax=Dorcoceras hygrometricum TaxID=472368 RepID=A0A2Z7BHG2_9LAMI|nr:hypothetical protein F511_11093 [Dorcoceras hygrometricum]
MCSSWFDAFMESAVELAMETSRVDSVVCNQAMAKVEPADDEDQLQALKSNRYSRRRRRSIDGAGTMKFSRKLQLKIQQMRRGASFGISCDDISLDVITISRWSEAQKAEATSY